MTAPTPTVCPTCKGDGEVVQLVRDEGGAVTGLNIVACPECCCDRCGTDVYTRGDGPQLCNDCSDDLGDDAYERSHQ